MGRHSITIDDVAREAGVSRQTVSRAINGKGEISEETRQRILGIADRLGYRPSQIARSLATRSSRTIGLIVPDIANPFFPEIARGAGEAAYALGYQLFLGNTAEDPDREWDVVRSLEEQWIAGLILCSSRLSDKQLTELSRRYYPLLLVNRRLDDIEVSSLVIDDFAGAADAVRYLLEQGHTRIGLLTGPKRSFSGKRRLEAYRAALLEAGIELDERWVVSAAPQVDGGRLGATELLAGAPELTAILAYNDLMALGAVQACQAAGRRVPEDCAIVGADDIPLAPLVTPALTTVQVDKVAVGRRAMELLDEGIRDDSQDRIVEVLPTRLVVRDSA